MSTVLDISKPDLVNDDDGIWREVGTLSVCLYYMFILKQFLSV
jgi:hypothetical protein